MTIAKINANDRFIIILLSNIKRCVAEATHRKRIAPLLLHNHLMTPKDAKLRVVFTEVKPHPLRCSEYVIMLQNNGITTVKKIQEKPAVFPPLLFLFGMISYLKMHFQKGAAQMAAEIFYKKMTRKNLA